MSTESSNHASEWVMLCNGWFVCTNALNLWLIQLVLISPRAMSRLAIVKRSLSPEWKNAPLPTVVRARTSLATPPSPTVSLNRHDFAGALADRTFKRASNLQIASLDSFAWLAAGRMGTFGWARTKVIHHFKARSSLKSNKVSGNEVAVKIEHHRRSNQLPQEQKIYQILRAGVGASGFPQLLFYGESEIVNILVMELLGCTIEDLFNRCNRKFSLKTILMLFDQMLARVGTFYLTLFEFITGICRVCTQ